VLSAWLGGCGAKKKPIIPVPVAPPPAAVPAPAPETAPAPAETTAPKPPRKAPQPAAKPTPLPPAPVPVPALGEILTDAQKREIEKDLAQNESHARAALTKTAGRGLTTAQRENAERIRTFLQQAEQARTRDLSTAQQLARRASLLADDLLKSLK
jgi:hypothetical protein